LTDLTMSDSADSCISWQPVSAIRLYSWLALNVRSGRWWFGL